MKERCEGAMWGSAQARVQLHIQRRQWTHAPFPSPIPSPPSINRDRTCTAARPRVALEKNVGSASMVSILSGSHFNAASHAESSTVGVAAPAADAAACFAALHGRQQAQGAHREGKSLVSAATMRWARLWQAWRPSAHRALTYALTWRTLEWRTTFRRPLHHGMAWACWAHARRQRSRRCCSPRHHPASGHKGVHKVVRST